MKTYVVVKITPQFHLEDLTDVEKGELIDRALNSGYDMEFWLKDHQKGGGGLLDEEVLVEAMRIVFTDPDGPAWLIGWSHGQNGWVTEITTEEEA